MAKGASWRARFGWKAGAWMGWAAMSTGGGGGGTPEGSRREGTAGGAAVRVRCSSEERRSRRMRISSDFEARTAVARNRRLAEADSVGREHVEAVEASE